MGLIGHNCEFMEARFLKRPDLTGGGVDELHAGSILVEKSSRNRLSVTRNQADRAVLRSSLFIRRHQRGAYLIS